MAELSKSGTYVKIMCHIWYDKKADNVHVTSNDKDLPKTHMHMTAKKGTQSDTNLRALLDKFNCGPTKKDQLTRLSETVDGVIELAKMMDGKIDAADVIYPDLLEIRKLVDEMLPEVE